MFILSSKSFIVSASAFRTLGHLEGYGVVVVYGVKNANNVGSEGPDPRLRSAHALRHLSPVSAGQEREARSLPKVTWWSWDGDPGSPAVHPQALSHIPADAAGLCG